MKSITVNGVNIPMSLVGMSKETLHVMSQVILGASPFLSAPFKEVEDGPKLTDAPAGMQILVQRLGWADIEITVGAALWMASVSDSPGGIVALAFVLRCLKNEPGIINLDDLSHRHFAVGVPSQEMLNAVWDAQKDGGLNLLDQPQFWKL